MWHTGVFNPPIRKAFLMKANNLRRGMIVKFEGDLWRVFDVEHQTPGNLRARVQTKLKNLRNGAMKDYRFRSEDDVEKAHMEQKQMQFLYRDGSDFHFMDTDSYEQIHMTDEALGDAVNYLIAETFITVDLYEGNPVGIELPTTVELKIIETTPEVKGATASAQRKPATLETGLVVQVPSFVKEGEVIRITTEDGQYLERVK
jgi:elongation factor P